MIFRQLLVALALLMCLATAPARANDIAIDFATLEFVDVIETRDGSVWRGLIVEQTPNVTYKVAIAGGSIQLINAQDVVKISKQRNQVYRSSERSPSIAVATTPGVGSATEQPPAPPLNKAGSLLEVDLAILFPTGDLKIYNPSFAPTIRVGYRARSGNLGFGVGGLARFTFWQIPGDIDSAHWTLETLVYGRAGVHRGRAAAYLGLALGIDTNYVNITASPDTATAAGLGVTLSSGIEVASDDQVALRFALEYHPGTDEFFKGYSTEYFAITIGANLRL